MISKSDTLVTDSSGVKFIVNTITIIGNKTTHDRIITRELTMHSGDTVLLTDLPAFIKRSEQNIFNTSLFNSVVINYLFEGNKLNLYILVTERWYIFPLPIFEIAERNFNVWWRTKDYSRIIYGGVLSWNNFRGRNELLDISVRFGYTQRVSFYYSVPFINRQQKAGLKFGFAYARNHQSSVKTINDDVTYYNDETIFTKKETGGSVAYNYRPNLYKSYSLEGGYKISEVADTITKLNPDYFIEGKSRIRYVVLRSFFRNDRRDIAFYPLHGYYFDAELVKNGVPALGDDIDVTYTSSHYRKFFQMWPRIYSAFALSGKYTFSSFVPYSLTRGLGYAKDYLRGYEYYVMDGQHFILLNTNLKFELLPKHEVHASFIPMNKFATIPYAFYLNVYGDIGYVRDHLYNFNNHLVNQWQYSAGAGIDFVTYYDMVFRFEYSINKFGESGFFLHFAASM